MVDIYDATNEEVRRFFSKGHKSGNKAYNFQSSTVQLSRLNKRNIQAKLSRQNRPELTGNFYDQAQQLQQASPGARSGNCYEMAVLAGYFAFMKHNVALERIFIGIVSAPADHVFCLITSAPLPQRLKPGGAAGAVNSYATIKEFTGTYASSTQTIIDPWLNTVCKVNEYLDEAGKKLDKWTGEGKRVFWDAEDIKNPKSTSWTWHVPNGDYKTQFAAGPLDLYAF